MTGSGRTHLRGIAFVATMLLGTGLGAETAAGQVIEQRAIPKAVTPPAEYLRAIERGWRSEDGSPGHSYWQQGTDYEIAATLDPASGLLTGTARILYAHKAPANLNTVWVHLHQNLHKEGAPRLETAEITGGMKLTRVAVDGEDLEEGEVADGPGYEVDGTLMQVRPTIRLEPGDTLELSIDWEVTLPQNGSGRMGHSEREMYFVAYWFPKMAMLDDLRLWSPQPYLGPSEFYDGFANYSVSLTVPENWTVMATGELENPDEVFSAVTMERLAAAAVSDERIVIAGAAERDAEVVTADSDDGWLTYRFQADNVRDFAWTTSNVQRWDATSAVVPHREEPVAEGDEDEEDDENDEDDEAEDEEAADGDEGGVSGANGATDRVLIHSFWREDRAPLWAQQWKYAKQSIEHHSQYTGFSYPWPHMTSVEGADIIDGGMEFPMLTLIGPYEDQEAQALFNVTSHELGHMWVPMIVGTDEKRHAWMDEGSTSFLEDESRMEIWPGVDHHRVEARLYLQVATAGAEQSMMRHGDYYEPGPGYAVASYMKPAALMVALREVMGRETWEEAYRTFISEWAFKHPTPWDFFSTFERFAEADLDWFWTSFYYETWTMDHAVSGASTNDAGGVTITIEDRGDAPFPAVVRVRTSGGTDYNHQIPVEHWLEGNTTYDIELPSSAGPVTRVEIDPGGFSPDIDRTNNFWPRGR